MRQVTPRARRRFAILCLASALSASSGSALEIATGRIVDPVSASAQMQAETAEQSYAIYLPSTYDRSRRWPVLFLFDARQRGADAAEVFRSAAEELGWILVSSNHARSDEDPQFSIQAMKAMWHDAHSWFSIDSKRVYATGFSGGARIAALLGSVRAGEVAGVIGCGAGFPETVDPTEAPPFSYFGAVGSRDFNYYQVLDLEQSLGAERTRVEIFEGGHSWPPPATARRALLWMEFQAVRSGHSQNQSAAETFWTDELARARGVAERDRLRAYELLQRLLREFEGVHDTAPLEPELQRLAHPEELNRLRRERQASRQWEEARLLAAKQAINQTAATAEPRLPFPKLLAAIAPKPLLAQATADEPRQAAAAARVLARLRVQTGFYLPRLFASQGDLRRAELMLDVATAMQPPSSNELLGFAVRYLEIERPKKAINALETALELGLDPKHLDDPRLLALSETKSYQRLRQQSGRNDP